MEKIFAEQKLKEIFGIDYFYDLQWETISCLMNGERVLLIEKTGYGKSLCFQFPALFFDGLTVVFSPLIALMRDQVKKLTALGVAVRCINSQQSSEENQAVINEATQGLLKILYIAPERQESIQWIEEIHKINLSMVVVDEAHCISVWGHDFRPAYRRIIDLVNLLPQGMPVLATTATATKRVEEDITQQIAGKLTIKRGNLMRDNFRLYVVRVSSNDEKLMWLGRYILKLPDTGIIYTGRIVETEIISKWFEFLNIPCRAYNGRLDRDTRIEVEEGLMSNQWKCVVSTNALGMGIDKPDIRFIIHTQFPQSPIHYYQEIGRAGRDGKPSPVILLYNPSDLDLPLSFIEESKPAINKYNQVISLLKEEMLGEQQLMRRTNLRQTQIRVIKADLIDQGIIRQVIQGRKKYFEFIPNSKPLNTELFEELRRSKTEEMNSMIRYAETKEPRMKYLCSYLGDDCENNQCHCDNTDLPQREYKPSQEWISKLSAFREAYFPVLEAESKNTNLKTGFAASYYGVSNVGAAIHRSKYESGKDFPDFLITLALKVYWRSLSKNNFDLILHIPPTHSGDLVKNFAVKISSVLKIPISHALAKARQTREQKVFENSLLKRDNVKDAFKLEDETIVAGKAILLIDDIYDSGATIKEAGRYLTKCGASIIVPLVIAKTVGGDIA